MMSMQDTIYFDYAAATPLDEAVHRAMLPYFFEDFYNPSSPYAPAVKTRRALENARHRTAVSIGASAADIIFTAGATESIALAMTAVRDGHVITTSIEHVAVLENARQYEHTIVGVDHKGRIKLDELKAAITEETQLVSVGLANSEIGTIQPLRQVAEIVKTEREQRLSAGNHRPIWLHSDASQGAGLLDIHVSRLGVDLLTLNAGKVYGPKQAAILWRRPGVNLYPILAGGGQEMGLRSGTESVVNAVGFAEAIEIAERKRKHESQRLCELRDKLQKRLLEAFDDIVISGDTKKRLPNHLHISFDGLDAERLVFILESRGVLVATGSACAANKGTRSHVLEAIGLPNTTSDGSLRLTLGKFTSDSHIERGADEIISAVRQEKERAKR